MTVGNVTLAKVAAQAAVDTPGVARLAPSLTRVVKSAVSKTARKLRTVATPTANGRPEQDAVDIEQHNGGLTVITVRIIATGQPPVLDTVNAVQLGVRSAVLELTGTAVEISVVVIDTEPAMTQTT
ncbi:MAG: hypothetical protein M3Y77_03605 [Actinomycetota bacterium]|nr:hypothetical protein [Actinomycetota bacterium]